VSAECILTDEEEWYRERIFPFVSYGQSADGRRKDFFISAALQGYDETPKIILKGSKPDEKRTGKGLRPQAG